MPRYNAPAAHLDILDQPDMAELQVLMVLAGSAGLEAARRSPKKVSAIDFAGTLILIYIYHHLYYLLKMAFV